MLNQFQGKKRRETNTLSDSGWLRGGLARPLLPGWISSADKGYNGFNKM